MPERRRIAIAAALIATPAPLVFAAAAWACDPSPAPSSGGPAPSPLLSLPPDLLNWEFPRAVVGASGWNSDCQPSLTSVTDPGVAPYLYYVASKQGGPPYDPADIWSGFSIYEARWNGARWTDVRVLPPPVNPGGFPSVTRDGTELYFAGGGRIKKALRSAGEWDTVVPLGWPFDVAGISYEAPEIAADGRRLYFVMDGVLVGGVLQPPSGPRNRDIWVVRVGTTSFDSLTNLGSGVNTSGVETRPSISPDGTRLVFSDFGGDRAGQADYGGVDLFVSVYENGAWQPAEPLPAPINNDYPACSAHWADDSTLYLGSEVSEGGFGEEDIWHAEPTGTSAALQDHRPVPAYDGPPSTWQLLTAFPGEVVVHDILALDAMTLLAGTAPGGRVYRSTDGGASWTGIDLEAGTLRVYDLARAADGSIYAGTYPRAAVFRSDDAGVSWTRCGTLPGSPTAVRALVALQSGDVLAGVAPEIEAPPPQRGRGALYRTSDRGVTWTASGNLTNVETGIYALAEPAPGIVLCGARGFYTNVHRSIDDGHTWTAVPVFAGDTTPSLFNAFTVYADTVWTTGWKHGKDGVLAYSPDWGSSWTRVLLPVQANGIKIGRTFDVARSPVHGWLLGTHPGPGTIAWHATHPLGTWSLLDHLEDARELLRFAVLDDGRVLAATSGFGEIWALGSFPTDVASPAVGRFDLRLRNPASAARIQGVLTLPGDGEMSVDLFDVRGALLGRLVNGDVSAGVHAIGWQLPPELRLRSGIYLVRVQQNGRFLARKLVLASGGR